MGGQQEQGRLERLQETMAPFRSDWAEVQDCHAADTLEKFTLEENVMCNWVDDCTADKYENPMIQRFPGMRFHHPEESIRTVIVEADSKAERKSQTVLRAGPAKRIFWDPKEVKAAIVTCGGLCPGLNSIIRDVTFGLYGNYNIKEKGRILGIRNGYNGFDIDRHPPLVLTPGVVEDIHQQGGSILGAGRGGFYPDFIIDVLTILKINHLYMVGGDGTQWAADVLFQVVKERKLKISIIGIPKTIDNDILYFDRSFGFHSAVGAGVAAIKSAFIEAKSCFNGVGIVKLMGRDSGFVARNATVASNICDAVLIPEVDFEFDGPDGLLAHIEYRLKRKGHAVVVVAEGAGQRHCATNQKDDTGHTIYGNVGELVRDRINAHLKKTVGGRCFFIDPSYMIRSVAATPNDNIYCLRMAHEAVHTAMRGYSGVCVGSVHDYMVMVPMRLIALGTRRVNVYSSIWQRCLESTGMPRALTGQNKPRAGNVLKVRGNPDMFRKKKAEKKTAKL
eukprot:TRINITY_DN72996_c0_g1_i1.p1 TRINITY_DN72996_c0_g1~~TRINITY_DN72996_c0_g1_i1.p1  ORF type:complete len:552 (+),score=238.08 TRINITY_DN72996_c0_g1_i1:144-1658(+)